MEVRELRRKFKNSLVSGVAFGLGLVADAGLWVAGGYLNLRRLGVQS